jgi:N6-L-threonylcarbamoyladenine synthase
MIILAFETSCDDTAVSVIKTSNKRMTLLSQVQYSQIKTHAKFGGVIPEVAAREHAVTIVPTLAAALQQAQVPWDRIALLATTQGPGLAPALSVGIDTARIISKLFNIPLLGVNHIEGHIASAWPIVGIDGSAKAPPRLPALALVVSGGHTELLLMKKFGSYRLLGRTRDDAAGEAFDKVATLLGLPYPGGPQVAKKALQGNRSAYSFPRPMINDASLDFSFSGLKTAVRYMVQGKRLSTKDVKNVCASFEQAAVDVLIAKTLRAIAASGAKSVLVVGGVSANTHLRSALAAALKKQNVPLYLAPHKLTSDNATMIAAAAFLGKKKASKTAWKRMSARPNWELG